MKRPSRLRILLLWLEYAAVRTITVLARLLPLRIAVSWSAKLWRILAPRLNPKRHRIALENLKLAFPEKSGPERLAICLAQWENLGRVVAETVQIDRLLADPSCIDISDQHLLARYRDKLGPAIGVGLHMGNWELAIWPLVVAGANRGRALPGHRQPLRRCIPPRKEAVALSGRADRAPQNRHQSPE